MVQVPDASMTARARSRRSAPPPFATERTNGLVSRPFPDTLSRPCRVIASTVVRVSMTAAISGVAARGCIGGSVGALLVEGVGDYGRSAPVEVGGRETRKM